MSLCVGLLNLRHFGEQESHMSALVLSGFIQSSFSCLKEEKQVKQETLRLLY